MRVMGSDYKDMMRVYGWYWRDDEGEKLVKGNWQIIPEGYNRVSVVEWYEDENVKTDETVKTVFKVDEWRAD